MGLFIILGVYFIDTTATDINNILRNKKESRIGVKINDMSDDEMALN
jgi:hypothetical protein